MSDKVYSDILREAPFLQEAVEHFIAILPERIAELNQSFEAGDLDEVAKTAHRLKGAGGTHGYSKLSDLARQVESAAKDKDAEGIERSVQELSVYLDCVEVVYE